jgi:SAM-dependent methyltransferase
MSDDTTGIFEFPGKYYEIIRRAFRSVEKETDFLASYLPAQGAVLDLGCGTGTTLRALSKRGHRCTGIDQSSQFIEYASAAGREIEYVHSSAVDCPITGTFDLVTCLFVTLNYMPPDDVPRLLARVTDWLAPGGHFVLDVAHLLNFVDGFEPNLIAHHVEDDVLITRFTRHTVHPHEGNWRHEESMLVRDGGAVSMYYNAFNQYVYTVRELHRMLNAAGLTAVSEFGAFDREVAPRGRGHRVIVAQRSV